MKNKNICFFYFYQKINKLKKTFKSCQHFVSLTKFLVQYVMLHSKNLVKFQLTYFLLFILMYFDCLRICPTRYRLSSYKNIYYFYYDIKQEFAECGNDYFWYL